MLSLEVLPATNGDCLWIEYGAGDRRYRVLIDGGTRPTHRLLSRRVADKHFDLMVLSHVDMDHIGGMLAVWQDPNVSFTVGDFWMNGRQHLDAPDVLGAKEGERLSRIIDARDVPWNVAFNKTSVVVPESGPLPVRNLPGDARVTLLSPYFDDLQAMIPAWDAALAQLAKEEARDEAPDVLGGRTPNVDALAAEQSRDDTAIPNGTSIAFLFEHGDHSVVFAADAHPSTLERSLRRLLTERQLNRLPLSGFKLSHHGSKANTTRDLLQLVDCPCFVFSTDGSGHGHPDPQCVARVLKNPSTKPKQLAFNYRSEANSPWDGDELKEAHNFSVIIPASGAAGCQLSWQ